MKKYFPKSTIECLLLYIISNYLKLLITKRVVINYNNTPINQIDFIKIAFQSLIFQSTSRIDYDLLHINHQPIRFNSCSNNTTIKFFYYTYKIFNNFLEKVYDRVFPPCDSYPTLLCTAFLGHLCILNN